MKRIPVLTCAAVVVLALVAVFATSASAAAPELVNKEGNVLVKKNFKGEGGTSTFQVKGQGSLSCEKLFTKGHVVSGKELTKELNFTECAFAGSKCKTGSVAGEVVFAGELSSLLVYEVVKTAALEPAVLVTIPAPVAVECESGQKLKMKGSFLILMTPANKLTKTVTIIGKQSGGEQATTEYEETRGGTVKKASLTTVGEGTKTFAETQTGVQLESSVEYEEEAQLRAPVGPELLNGKGEELVKKGFKGEGGKAAAEIKGQGKVSCSSTTVSGEVISAATLGKTLTFGGCAFGESKCNTEKGAAGEVVFNQLGSLFVYEVVKKEVLEPAVLVTLGKTLQLECGSQAIFLKGSFLLLVTPVNKFTNALTIVGKQSGGIQESTEYEESKGGEVKSAVLLATGEGTKTFAEVDTGLEFEATNNYEEEVELKG